MNRWTAYGILWVTLLIIPVHRSWAKNYYQYKDEQGRTHVVETIDRVPREYREEAQNVDLSGSNKNHFWSFLFGPAQPTYIESARSVPRLVIKSLAATRLLYSLIVELLLLIGALWLLSRIRDFPTRRDRNIFTVLVLSAYLAILLLSLALVVLPQSRKFISQSKASAAIIKSSGKLKEQEKADFEDYIEWAGTWENRL